MAPRRSPSDDDRADGRPSPTAPPGRHRGLAALGGSVAQAAIDALVADLPPDQAEVVLLRVVAGLGVDEVAEIMGKRPGTVRVLQHRALRRLAQIHATEDVTP